MSVCCSCIAGLNVVLPCSQLYVLFVLLFFEKNLNFWKSIILHLCKMPEVARKSQNTL